ncbi:unnamed protein product [Diatraea saccharalis]|uniref:Uncharacterized protein n=1 Tax=Diatraea saccharalis TaxID=40085 RepID=A0A9N9R8A6_9NEOP|nr:unnamed protein product [Diatraea saccharalis]
MEDFDVFTNEINYTKQFCLNILNKYVNDAPLTPNAPNYQCGRKLLADECLSASKEEECAFHMSEAISASLRTMAVYRDEQIKSASNKLQKITSFIKPIQDVIDANPLSKDEQKLYDLFSENVPDIDIAFSRMDIVEDVPFHKRYLRFGPDNNVENFQKILKELPKEWSIIQLTAPYNPNENLKPQIEYKIEINSLYLTMYSNEYLDKTEFGPMTINIPANVTKDGEKPLFTELFSLLEDNYKTIDNAQFLNNKRLVQNYWSRREDIDLRMKSVIHVMDKDWLGGFGSLLTGKLVDSSLSDNVMKLVDVAISDWGKILTEHGDPEEIRQVLDTSDCETCTREFRFLNELCIKCLSKCFEAIHHFTLVDGIKAFSKVATQIKEDDEWACLKKAKRHPVILLVDEQRSPLLDIQYAVFLALANDGSSATKNVKIVEKGDAVLQDALDTFPWETLPIINQHPVSRMENIHFLYYLYKIHESRITDGYFNARADVGRYVINPGRVLKNIEHVFFYFFRNPKVMALHGVEISHDVTLGEEPGAHGEAHELVRALLVRRVARARGRSARARLLPRVPHARGHLPVSSTTNRLLDVANGGN